MIYTTEVQHMCPVAKGAYHGPAPIPEEGKWVQAKEISDISGFTHGVGWCAPQQGACKLTLNVKDGIIEEALVETIGCSGMTHSAAMAAEILHRQDPAGSAEHRPGLRRHQHGHAGAVPADRLWPHPVRVFRGRPARRRLPGGPGQGPAQPGRHHVCHQGQGLRAIWKWPRAMCTRVALNERRRGHRLSNSSTWAR